MCTVHTHKNGESSSSSSREESDERRGSPAVKKIDVSVLILMYDNLPAYHQHDQRPAVEQLSRMPLYLTSLLPSCCCYRTFVHPIHFTPHSPSPPTHLALPQPAGHIISEPLHETSLVSLR